jgi:inner membrane protein
VASPITHAFVGVAFPVVLFGRTVRLPIALLSLSCAIIPDLDKVAAKVLGTFGTITLASIWSHRGISHSLLFALLLSLVSLFLAVRRRWSSESRRRLFLLFFLVSVSHGLIDIFAGTYGVALFAPFSATRYLYSITAISSTNFWQSFTPAMGPVLVKEMLWIWFPLSMVFVLIRLAAFCRANKA